MPVHSLSFHARYRCHEVGACCTAGWPIPIEHDRLASAERALIDGRIPTAVAAPLAFIRPNQPPDRSAADTPAALVAIADGACVFHHRGQSCGCGLQRALGHAALPLACRQFPRVSILDPRGVSITLSHYCPTAAVLLDDPAAASIVLDAGAFPADGEYVGLEARTSLPPLLRPGMLMDWDAWWAWEARSVALIAAAPGTRQALDALHVAVERTRTWSPGGRESLIDRVTAAFTDLSCAPAPLPPEAHSGHGRARIGEVLAAIPEDLRPDPASLTGPAPRPGTRLNFLLAHAFANWTGYLGQGLRSWRRSLEAADALIEAGASVRTADLLLRHLADPFVLAERWSEAERA